MGEHKNKVSKWSRVAGGLASAAGAAGAVGIVTAGSLSGLNAGFRVMNAASGLSTVADVAEGLAGSYGMDIVFKGKSSSYSCTPNDGKIRLIVRGENNDADPMELYRIVRFNSSKKERRIQWMEIKPALLGSKEADKAGYVAFDAHKYGESSYIITTKADQIEEGEYGIIFMNASLSTVIPIATFSVN